MINIVLVDDDYLIHEQFTSILSDQRLDLFLNGSTFLETLDQTTYDLIFLDIYLPDMTGMALGRRIRQSPNNSFCPIVYLSQHTDAALKLFATQPVDFLIKPVSAERIRHIVDSVRFGTLGRSIEIKQGRRMIRIMQRDIIYMESIQRLLMIHTRQQSFRTYHKMTDFDLSYPIVRIHQSFQVNLDYAAQVTKHQIYLFDQTVLPISRRYQEDIRQLLVRLAKQVVV